MSTSDERLVCAAANSDGKGGGDISTCSVTRRDFFADTGVASVAVAFAPASANTGVSGTEASEAMPMRLRVNGVEQSLSVDPRTTLLDLLRETLALTGSKKGCDHGQCGACTVLVDQRRINACLALALSYDGANITTVEGLASGETLHAMQAAFVRHDGFQCGYCTPGQICSAIGMLSEVASGAASHATENVRRVGRIELTDAEIRERMSGNICRCGAYPGIVASVREVAQAAKTRGGRA
jgi:xanthine dehydrogenase YagT iron-sulfur-binding subunit